MSRDYKVYLEDILEAAEKIERYLQDVNDLESFRQNDLLIDAVIHNLFVIGEAVKHIPPDVRAKYPEIEWRRIAGLRDVIAHMYFGIKLEIIWDSATNKLPELRLIIQRILDREG
jgi:uncharacterized protein with HEPN domain